MIGITDLPKREPYERQFIKLMAKGMRELIEERIQEEKEAEFRQQDSTSKAFTGSIEGKQTN